MLLVMMVLEMLKLNDSVLWSLKLFRFNRKEIEEGREKKVKRGYIDEKRKKGGGCMEGLRKGKDFRK